MRKPIKIRFAGHFDTLVRYSKCLVHVPGAKKPLLGIDFVTTSPGRDTYVGDVYIKSLTGQKKDMQQFLTNGGYDAMSYDGVNKTWKASTLLVVNLSLDFPGKTRLVNFILTGFTERISTTDNNFITLAKVDGRFELPDEYVTRRDPYANI